MTRERKGGSRAGSEADDAGDDACDAVWGEEGGGLQGCGRNREKGDGG